MVGSPTLSGGKTYTTQFPVAGHYELFCYLHPLTMHQVVEVQSRAGAATARGGAGQGGDGGDGPGEYW